MEAEFCDVVDEMTQSMSSVREVLRSLGENDVDLDMKDGISLLSLKHHIMLSYLNSLALLSARRALGHPLSERSPPSLPFSSPERGPRGPGAGDLVDSMLEGRLVLEKIKMLESKMKYQIQKLVSAAEEDHTSDKNIVDDQLAFRPNPENLVDNDETHSAHGGEDDDAADDSRADGIYRPPRLAPMPYTESTRDKRSRRNPVPNALSSLQYQDPSRPHIESTSGLGSMPSLSSNRAREIARISEFEESNFTRIMMKKKDAKRRQKDEEDIALGGSGGISGRRRGGGLEDEFGDVLKSVGRTKLSAVGDGYEELRKRGKKSDVLARSRMRDHQDAFEGDEIDGAPRMRKRSRFEKETKAVKKRTLKGRR